MYPRPPWDGQEKKPVASSYIGIPNTSGGSASQHPWNQTNNYSQYPYPYVVSGSVPFSSQSSYEYYQQPSQQTWQAYNDYYQAYYSQAQPSQTASYSGTFSQYPAVYQGPQVSFSSSSSSSNDNPQPGPQIEQTPQTHSVPSSSFAKPAYTSIKTTPKQKESSFQQNQSDATSNEQKEKSWPSSLREYVEKTFSKCETDAQRDEEEIKLKQVIKDAIVKGELWTRDWSNFPIQDERKSAEKKTMRLEVKKVAKQENRDFGFLDLSKKEKRAQRFANEPLDSARVKRLPTSMGITSNDDMDWSGYQIVGTNTMLEKRYLRLTSAPDPSTVRPLHILKKTFELLKTKWIEKEDYHYICDQFKSMRQDLTVQRIKNEFTVQVYEAHARIALEKADLGEYNQCQSQLKQLYKEGLPGSVDEFLAYRILYCIHTKNRLELTSLLSELSKTQKEQMAVHHALQVRSAVALNDYHALFRLYRTCPNLGLYLMKQFVDRERVHALKIMCKAYRPALRVAFIEKEIVFRNRHECITFLESKGALFKDSHKTELDTKSSYPAFEEASRVYAKIDIKGQI